jgi:hypothetical protein
MMAGVSEEMPLTEEATGIRTTFIPSISKEQDEPLLLLPDHLAGFYYSQKAYGKGTENDRKDFLQAAEALIAKWRPDCVLVSEYQFGEDYLLHRGVFDHVQPRKQRQALLSDLIGRRGISTS